MSKLSRRHMLLGLAGTAGAAPLAAPAIAQTVPSSRVQVELFGLATNNWDGVIEHFHRDYPNVTVKSTRFGTDEMKQALRVGASSGQMPNLWFNWGGSLASPYNRAGLALDITDRVKELKLDQTLVPTAITLASDRGRLYGVPNRVVPMSIVYRKEMLERAGVEPPRSFAELETVCEKLRAKNITPFSLGGKFSWQTMRFTDFFMEHFAGPDEHDRILAMESSWESEPVVKAFTKLREWVTKSYFNLGFLNVDPATNMTLVYQGRAAMVFEVPNVDLTRLKRENIDANTYGTVIAPSDHPRKRVSGFQQQLQISARAPAEVQNAALLFATYVVRPDLAVRHMGIIGAPSAVRGTIPAEEFPLQRQWATWLQGDVSLYLPGDQALPQEVVAAYFEAQDSVVLGTLKPQEAAAQVQKAITAYKSRHN
jgi:raffinose/stachyose/melibiose transport system substrate-binding protein